jgi:tetratricopeptide (TPR) repeat protein
MTNERKSLDEMLKALEEPAYNEYASKLSHESIMKGLEAEDMDEKIKYLEAAVNLNPNDSFTHVSLAEAYESKKEYEKAINHCQRAISLNRNSMRTHLILGTIYSSLEEKGKAKESFEKARELYERGKERIPKEDLRKLYHEIGLMYGKAGNHDEAIACFQKAISFEQSNEESIIHLAVAYYNKGDYDKAVEAGERALKIGKGHEHFYNVTKNFHLDMLAMAKIPNQDKMREDADKFDGIISFYKRRIAQACFILSKVYEEKGMKEKAEECAKVVEDYKNAFK